MPDITLPTTSAPGFRQQENGGRIINAYAERLDGSARWKWVLRRSPGLLRAVATGHTGCRGLIEVGGALYSVQNGRAVRITRSGGVYTVLDLGELEGTDGVTLARNNKSPTPDVLGVNSNGVFALSPTAVTLPTIDNLPQPTAVCSGASYFFFGIADGRVFASAINDTTVGALDFTTADARPDGLKRVVFLDERLLAMGQSSIQIYQNTGNAEGFPFSAGPVISRGLAGKFAVAGWEEGWTGALIWVGDDNVVYLLNGSQPTPISTSHLSRLIAAVADKETLEASVHTHGSHAKWVLSSPNWTWEYNLTTQQWNERHSYGESRWRAARSVKAFDRWLVGDTLTDRLFEVSDETFAEDGSPIPIRIETGPQHSFPSRLAFPRVDFDIATGWGLAGGLDPVQTDPTVDISWSDDSGVTWSMPLRRSIGRQGEYDIPVSVNRTGSTGAKGRCWRLENADLVYFGAFGGYFDAVQRAA